MKLSKANFLYKSWRNSVAWRMPNLWTDILLWPGYANIWKSFPSLLQVPRLIVRRMWKKYAPTQHWLQKSLTIGRGDTPPASCVLFFVDWFAVKYCKVLSLTKKPFYKKTKQKTQWSDFRMWVKWRIFQPFPISNQSVYFVCLSLATSL